MTDYFQPFRPMSMVAPHEERQFGTLYETLNPKPRTHVAPMVTVFRSVDGVFDGSIRVRIEPKPDGSYTIDAREFFAPRPCDEGKRVQFSVSLPDDRAPTAREFPMWSTDKSAPPGCARALAALQKRGAR